MKTKSIKKKKNSKNRKEKKKISLRDLTILEVLAIILILSAILTLISPLFADVKDNSDKRKYIKDVNTYIDRAAEMYGDNNYKNKFTKTGNTYTITFNNIDKVNIETDPYGFTYIKEDSYVEFNSKTKDVIVNVKSCITKDGLDYCYEIVEVNTKELNLDSIKTSVN